MTYEQIKENRKVTYFSDLPLSIQSDIKDFIYFYKPTSIKLCGSFYHGSWIGVIDSDFAKLRLQKGKRIRLSDCDIVVNKECRCPNKYKSIDIVNVSVGVLIYSDGTFIVRNDKKGNKM